MGRLITGEKSRGTFGVCVRLSDIFNKGLRIGVRHSKNANGGKIITSPFPFVSNGDLALLSIMEGSDKPEWN